MSWTSRLIKVERERGIWCLSLPDLIRSPSPPLPVSASLADHLRLFSLPGTHLFCDAALPVSFTDPHILHILLLSPPLETLDTSSLISKVVSSCSPADLASLLRRSAAGSRPHIIPALISVGVVPNG